MTAGGGRRISLTPSKPQLLLFLSRKPSSGGHWLAGEEVAALSQLRRQRARSPDGERAAVERAGDGAPGPKPARTSKQDGGSSGALVRTTVVVRQ